MTQKNPKEVQQQNAVSATMFYYYYLNRIEFSEEEVELDRNSIVSQLSKILSQILQN